MKSLWGEDFDIIEKPKPVKSIIKKASKPRDTAVDVKKATASKTLSLDAKLDLIRENVYRILGKYKDQTICIRDRESLAHYIDAAIANGEIAIDTETNNSLDPITCKLMGPCIYTPGQKNAYIPINHVNKDTRELLPNQLTEEDIREEFERLNTHNTHVITHNGKFDYQVLKCTTLYKMHIYWDTLIGAKILDENELSYKLKEQYKNKIDPSAEKYDIENLFEHIEYALVDPELFALYAATDAVKTYELYRWQLERFNLEDNSKLKSLFLDIEMPVMEVAAEMELTGVELDKDYASLLSKKYHKQLDLVDAEINQELEKISSKIAEWRLTPEANVKPTTKTGKPGKSKSEQLEEPINLGSPTQLAILLYDVLKLPCVDTKQPRGTGEDQLKKLSEYSDICKYMLDRRGVVKLLDAFIDSLPQEVNPKTGRIHCSFNQLGAATGRFSCSEPNLQQIPSHDKTIRLMFRASTIYQDVSIIDELNCFKIPYTDEVLTIDGWKKVKDVSLQDSLVNDDEIGHIKDIKVENNIYYIYVE